MKSNESSSGSVKKGKAKLSELVAQLEKDFDFQYNQNIELRDEHCDLKEQCENAQQETLALAVRLQQEQLGSTRWQCCVFALLLTNILAIALWLMYCPTASFIYEFLETQTQALIGG